MLSTAKPMRCIVRNLAQLDLKNIYTIHRISEKDPYIFTYVIDM